MNIQNIQSISQNVEKTYGMLNELGSNGLELMKATLKITKVALCR